MAAAFICYGHKIPRFAMVGKCGGSCECARMTLKPLGDSAWLVEFPSLAGETARAKVTGLAAALAEGRPPEVLDVVPSFDTLAVHFEGDGDVVSDWICGVEILEQLPEGKTREIPVCYGGAGGPDLEKVAARVGMSVPEVIELHSGASYTVAAVGFSPGFPYLAGLPERLALPRLETPRVKVPAGSVAIGGGQAGIYPFDSPGGWHLLGTTDTCLFDVGAVPPALLQPGDRVKFVAVAEVSRQAVRVVEETGGDGWIEVISPGALTSVQDRGRPGYESSGVSPGGAVDRHALRLANLLVGNEEGAAVLEMCVSGPVLKFHRDTVVAVAGGNGSARRVVAGETVDFSKLPGVVRACLAVAGGLKVEKVLGSAATDVRGGFGGRLLRAGDRLATGGAGRTPRMEGRHVGREAAGRTIIELRFLRGVQDDWFSAEARERFRSDSYQLTPRSDRMGARLAGKPLELAVPRQMVSQPVACGSVQVPPDGQPIVLLAERQTIGGYPQIGHVISVDLPLLARAWPGTALRFREVGLEEARALLDKEKRNFDWLRTGLDLLK